MKTTKLEVVLWSIAFPGFGQFLNRQHVKGIVFIVLEFIINVQSNFNETIMLSFNGQITDAIKNVDYQWLMFYPCVYMYAMWDAYKNAEGKTPPFSYLPFVCSAYTVTTGLMYSKVKIFGVLFGPIWLPMLSVIPGVVVGLLLRKLLIRKESRGL
jgi:hypothetical protein